MCFVYQTANEHWRLLCEIRCILYTVYCVLYTVYSILYTVYFILYTVYCILYTVLVYCKWEEINNEVGKRLFWRRDVCVCVLSSHLFWTSDLWTHHQPGSHRRNVTQDLYTFLFRCLPYFLPREGSSHPFPSSTVKSDFCVPTNKPSSTCWACLFVFILFYFVRKNPGNQRNHRPVVVSIQHIKAHQKSPCRSISRGKRHNRVGIPRSKHETAGYLLIYSVKRTQLIGRRPLLPCRVRKTAGYTLPHVYFSPELYPDFPKCTLTWREVGLFHRRLFFPHESLSAPSKGHQNPNLSA